MDQSFNRFQCLDAAHVLHSLYDSDTSDQERPTVLVGGNGNETPVGFGDEGSWAGGDMIRMRLKVSNCPASL
jgi:hypothetical protein